MHLARSEVKTCPDLKIISKEIWELTTEIKDAFRTSGETLRSDVRKDLDDFKQDISQQLAKVAAEQRLQSGKINKAKSQIEKLEHWAQEANDALIISLNEQKAKKEIISASMELLREWRVSLRPRLCKTCSDVNCTCQRILTSKFKECIGHSHRDLQVEPS